MVNFNQNGKKVNKSYSLKHHTSRNKADDSLNLFKVFHQNIRGLKSKADELSTSPFPNYPHIICLTEHHLRDCEINMIPIDRFKLGSKFCRWEYKNGGVCIYIHEDLDYSTISQDSYCKEKDIEVCAVKLNTTPRPLIVIPVYRSPSGSFNDFLINLDSILNMLYSSKTEFVICGDININYLDSCVKRQQLDALFQTYNLIGTVLFPACKSSTSATAIDNIFITQTKS